MNIHLPYPPTVNTYYRNVQGCVKISAKGRKYRKSVIDCIWAHRGVKRYDGDLKMKVDIHPPDRRKRDIDNISKALLDSLEKAGVYSDDNQICDLHLVRQEVRKGGLVIVNIEER